jgi:hypothetical protein
MHTSDEKVLQHIQALVDEEHRLLGSQELPPPDRGRLENVRVELDQCWDLLQQRRAKAEFGADPDDAEVRPPDVVEGYQRS